MTAPEDRAPEDRAPGGTARLARYTVARIGFGTMQLESRSPSREAAVAILRQAAGAGVNHIDTAQFYLGCNALIRTALAPYPDDLVVATKAGAQRDTEGRLVPAQHPAQLRAPESGWATSRPTSSARRCRPESPASRTPTVPWTARLSRCLSCAVSTASPGSPISPLGSAFPGRPRVTESPTVRAIAADLSVTPAQVGLAWQLAHYQDTLLIPGTADPGHLAENVAAGSVSLPASALAALSQLAG